MLGLSIAGAGGRRKTCHLAFPCVLDDSTARDMGPVPKPIDARIGVRARGCGHTQIIEAGLGIGSDNGGWISILLTVLEDGLEVSRWRLKHASDQCGRRNNKHSESANKVEHN